jgi:hypothetical protein
MTKGAVEAGVTRMGAINNTFVRDFLRDQDIRGRVDIAEGCEIVVRIYLDQDKCQWWLLFTRK